MVKNHDGAPFGVSSVGSQDWVFAPERFDVACPLLAINPIQRSARVTWNTFEKSTRLGENWHAGVQAGMHLFLETSFGHGCLDRVPRNTNTPFFRVLTFKFVKIRKPKKSLCTCMTKKFSSTYHLLTSTNTQKMGFQNTKDSRLYDVPLAFM